jgi:histone H3
MDSPRKVNLFGRTLPTSSNASPSQLANHVTHHKPRIVRPIPEDTASPVQEEDSGEEKNTDYYSDSSFKEEGDDDYALTSHFQREQYSIEEENSYNDIEVEEMTPGDARESTLPSVIALSQRSSRASQTQRSTGHAVAIITRKKSNVTQVRRVPTEQTEKSSKGAYEDEDVDMNVENNSSDDIAEPVDRLNYLKWPEFYTDIPQRTKGKGVLGKRPQGKAYGGKSRHGAGGKSPRGVGGKAPRVPSGAGKAPAVSDRERQEQRRRVIHLEGTSNNNNNNVVKAITKPKKKKPKRTQGMPVGTKPKVRDKNAHLKEIDKLQKEDKKFMIPKKPFQNLVREIVREKLMENWKWARSSLEALQCAAEEIITEFLDLGNVVALHGKRKTLMVRDLHLILNISAKLRALLTEWHALP